MKIIEIKASERAPEMLHLFEEHADELATQRDIMIVKPDVARYMALEKAGALPSLALIDDCGNIVGYSLNILAKNMHYSDLDMAKNDILFIRKDLRRGSWGVRLIAETERLCKARLDKTFVMLFHGKPDTAFSALMPKLEYGVQDIMFSKVIK